MDSGYYLNHIPKMLNKHGHKMRLKVLKTITKMITDDIYNFNHYGKRKGNHDGKDKKISNEILP